MYVYCRMVITAFDRWEREEGIDDDDFASKYRPASTPDYFVHREPLWELMHIYII